MSTNARGWDSWYLLSQSLEAVMPAVTADTLTLPRVPAAALGDTERDVRQVSTGPKRVGDRHP
jgi:hypothetical protein